MEAINFMNRASRSRSHSGKYFSLELHVIRVIMTHCCPIMVTTFMQLVQHEYEFYAFALCLIMAISSLSINSGSVKILKM